MARDTARRGSPADERSAEWIEAVAETAPDVVLQLDLDAVVVFSSGDIREVLEVEPDAVPGRHLFDFVSTADQQPVLQTLAGLAPGSDVAEQPVILQLQSGRKSVRLRARPLLDATRNVSGFVVGLRDETRGTASLRAVASLLEANRVLLRAKSEEQLFQQMCDAITGSGDYAFAWYGAKVDDAAHSVRALAVSGDDRGYVGSIKVSWAEDEFGNGPTGLAIRTRATQVRNDLEHDPRYAPWRDATSSRGIKCAIALPVTLDNEVHGALMVYAQRAGSFDYRAQEILETLAADIGHGLARLAAEQRLRATLDSLLDPYFLLRPLRDSVGVITDFTVVDANAAGGRFAADFGRQIAGATLSELFDGGSTEQLVALLASVSESGRSVSVDDFRLGGSAAPTFADIQCAAIGELVGLNLRDVTDRHQAAAAVEAAEARYRLIAENASDVVFMVDADLVVTWVSPSITAMTGWTRDDLIGRVVAREFLHPDESAGLLPRIERVSPGANTLSVRARFRCAEGDYRWMEISGRTLYGDADEIVSRVVSMRDVHAQTLAEQDLRNREEQFRLLAQNASDVVISVNDSGLVDWVSPSSRAMLGYEPEEIVGATAALILRPEDVPLVGEAAAGARAGKQTTWRLPIQRKDGSEFWAEVNIRPLLDDRGVVVGRIAAIRDIDAEVHTQEALDQELAFDALTGTAKKRLAIEWIQEILDSHEEPGWPLLCVGVYGMTSINQAFTYQGGDEVLRVVAERLVAATGAHDRVARIAGDEFAVLLRNLLAPGEAAAAAERIIEATQGPVRLDGREIDVHVSVGIAPASDTDAEALLRNATAAMREAAKKGGGHWAFLGEDVSERSRHLLEVQKRLRTSMDEDALVAWFMPVVSLTTGDLAGYEALLRWVMPDGSVVGPDQFLMAAENSDLIIGIDRMQVRNAIRASTNLPSHLNVGVNLSAFTMQFTDFVSFVTEELERHGADPHQLNLEVTETSLLRASKEVVEPMRELAAVGCQWWVDDFGTGYSSISHLRDLPISGLKLDRAFTAGTAVENSPAARITQGLAGLAIGLGLHTIAEGVESQAQAEVLASQGWEFGQGYLYGQAAPL